MRRSKKYSAVVAFVILGTVGCYGDRSHSPSASALIQDANHLDGNAFFVWLPPLLQQQAPAEQVFSEQLRPTVTISNLCSGAVIRALSGADVQIADGAYHANWHTADDNLDPSCTYRIAVETGSRQLGTADVDVVDDGSELKNVDTDEFIALLDDRTLPIKFYIGVGSQCQRADSDCGEGTAQPDQNTTIVTTHGQAGVFIPAGAVDQPVTIIVESADDRPCIAGLLEPVFSGNLGAVGNSCYDIHTDPPLTEINAAGKFNTNVTVGICPVIGTLDLKRADQLCQCQGRLRQCELRANADSRADPERQVGEAVGRRRTGQKARRIEHIRLGPEPAVAVQQPRRDHHDGALGDRHAIGLVGGARDAKDAVGRRVEP